MKRVYLSYSYSDASEAGTLANVLSAEGLDVIRPEAYGWVSDWNASVFSAIRRCSAFVAILSEVSAPNVMLEIGYALGTSKQVFLICKRGVRVPFDVASLPVFYFDELDPLFIYTIADRLRDVEDNNPLVYDDLPGAFQRLQLMLHDPNYLEQVSPEKFVSYIHEWFQELGFRSRQVSSNHDYGCDILLEDPGTQLRAVVEVKKYSKSGVLGVSAVHQLLGAMTLSNATCAILVSTGGFSASAKSMAHKSPRPILLMGLEDLLTATRASIRRSIDQGR